MKNIEIGIDLGTTNSEIVILNNGNTEIVKNTYGDEFTPSVFGVSKAKDEEVGKKPYQRYFKDATKDEIKNNKPEIKRLMGTSDKVYFSRIDKKYNAEEISAKILSYLKQEAMRKNDKLNTSACVITIPAHFSTMQAEATKRAGLLAGFKYVVLLQEPIAAAISYGFGKNINENWLVYDLGGGTFDVALISSKDGNLKVLGHNGDNFLGGKDIDAKIVEDIIIPKLKEKYNLSDFDISNPNYNVWFAKLKYAAEQAKIQLSSLNEVNIEIDMNIDGEEIYENILISRTNLEKILDGMLNKTISLCKQTIDESGIKNSGVNKIILVGGPTQLPFIKTRLENGLNIQVDTSSDPLTAVARGACIYATGETIPDEFLETKVIDDSVYEVRLNYESLTSEEEELITGIVPKLKQTNDEYFFQIQSNDNTFNTGKKLIRDGKIVANIAIKPNKLNSYWFYLFDKDGNTLNSSIDEFSITHGLSISGAPIPHSIGIGVSERNYAASGYKQKFEVFFEKNSILPLEKTISYKTIKTIKKGDFDNCLPITVYEGENKIPEHNIFVCEIALTGRDVNSNLYEGSQIDITIKVDKSRVIEIEAYIPDLNQSINAKATMYDENLSIDKLTDDLDKEIDKMQNFEHLCSNSERESIYKDINDIKKSLEIAKNDEDEKRKTNIKVKNLKAQINKLEELKNEDSLIDEYNNLINKISELIDDMSDNNRQKVDFIKQFENIKSDGDRAIQNKNSMLLSKINEQLDRLSATIILSDDRAWIYFLHELAENPLVNESPYLQRGFQALENGDMDTVRNCVQMLMRSLPDNEQANIQSKIAGITR